VLLGRRALGRPKRRREGSINLDRRMLSCQVGTWRELAQDRVLYPASMFLVLKLSVTLPESYLGIQRVK
jgi:hypothetical protein